MARSDARRTEILDATLACYARLGWAAATIADIREESGASTGSIYHHFGSKEGVGAALHLELFRRYHEDLGDRLDRTRSARSFVRTLVHHHLDWAAEHPDWARFLGEVRRSGIPGDQDGRDVARGLLDQVGNRLQTHVDAGEIVRMPKPIYPSVILGPAHDVVRRWLHAPDAIDIDEARTPLANAAWRAVAS